MALKIAICVLILVAANYLMVRSLKKQVVREFGQYAWTRPFKYTTIITILRILLPVSAVLMAGILYLLGVFN